ncbi:MAG: hypothetical protein AABY97_03045, partial [Chloroflexota bacterium]
RPADADVRLGVTQRLGDDVAIDRLSYDYEIAWAYAEQTSGSRTLDTRFWAEAGMTSEAQWSHIIALRYKEPTSSQGSEQVQ